MYIHVIIYVSIYVFIMGFSFNYTDRNWGV
jgi:hypothetical protein